MTIKIFHWPPAKSPTFHVFGGKFHFSNRQKKLPCRERHIMTYWAWACVQRCDLWAWLKREKRTETFMRQTGYLPRSPTAPEILHAGSCPGNSYIFQVSWKSVQGFRTCGGRCRKLPSPIDLAHDLYNSLYYCRSRDYSLRRWRCWCRLTGTTQMCRLMIIGPQKVILSSTATQLDFVQDSILYLTTFHLTSEAARRSLSTTGF